MNWSLYSIERNLNGLDSLYSCSYWYIRSYTFILINLFTQVVLSFIINKIRKEKANGFIN